MQCRPASASHDVLERLAISRLQSPICWGISTDTDTDNHEFSLLPIGSAKRVLYADDYETSNLQHCVQSSRMGTYRSGVVAQRWNWGDDSSKRRRESWPCWQNGFGCV